MIDPHKTLIFDAEIIRAIAITPDERERYDEQGIEYVTDWNAHDQMGVSVLCAPTLAQCLAAKDGAELYASAMFFTSDMISNAEYFFSRHDLLVSYNGNHFDAPLLRANGCYLDDAKHYDLAAAVRAVTGRARPPKMDDLAGANDLPRKTGDGALAPVLWQRGEHRRVIEYCFNDCRVLAHLFQRVIERGTLCNPYANALMTIAPPSRKARLF